MLCGDRPSIVQLATCVSSCAIVPSRSTGPPALHPGHSMYDTPFSTNPSGTSFRNDLTPDSCSPCFSSRTRKITGWCAARSRAYALSSAGTTSSASDRICRAASFASSSS